LLSHFSFSTNVSSALREKLEDEESTMAEIIDDDGCLTCYGSGVDPLVS
jgi:hypothetical protein